MSRRGRGRPAGYAADQPRGVVRLDTGPEQQASVKLFSSSGYEPIAEEVFGGLDVDWRARSQDGQTKTSPEELIAAAHAACFSMAFSLMLGNNLPDTDAALSSLLTNDEVLAIDQDPLGQAAVRVAKKDGAEAWVKASSGEMRPSVQISRSNRS